MNLSKHFTLREFTKSQTAERKGIINEPNEDQIEFMDFDLGEPYNIEKTIDKVQPDEFYNLAAQSFVGLSFEQPQVTTIANALGVLNILEVIRNKYPKVKFYQASNFTRMDDLAVFGPL